MAVSARFYMHVHNLHQQRAIQMLEGTHPDGPRHNEVWTSTITIVWSASGRGVGAYTACDRSRQGARDAASRMALTALGYDVNTLA
ncbi:hypothetical protein FRB99_008632 [Tulasnella sp. 403]|nr:hypothetical protein FRB99_008632 [Tulasnella sp. 403]